MSWGARELWEAKDPEGGSPGSCPEAPPGEQMLLLGEGPGSWGNQIHRILRV